MIYIAFATAIRGIEIKPYLTNGNSKFEMIRYVYIFKFFYNF